VDILIDIFIKKEEFQETIYLIDEPELHINTNIQRKLLNEIVSIIPDTCQIWIATHSIGFLNALKQDHHDDSAVIWFTPDLVTKQTVVSPMIKSRKNWKIVFETALEDLTGLMSPETIVYCEGRKDLGNNGEEQGLDAEVYNTIFESEFSDTLFVSSGGNTEPDKYSEVALKVLSKAFDGVVLLLLKDKDIHADATATTDSDRDAWIAADPTSRRMLIRKEIENYLFDIEIIKKFKIDIDEAEYVKLVSDIKDGDVKSIGVALKKLCGQEQKSERSFKQELSALVTPETGVYKELKSVIFG
jgi:hypothetical protein